MHIEEYNDKELILSYSPGLGLPFLILGITTIAGWCILLLIPLKAYEHLTLLFEMILLLLLIVFITWITRVIPYETSRLVIAREQRTLQIRTFRFFTFEKGKILRLKLFHRVCEEIDVNNILDITLQKDRFYERHPHLRPGGDFSYHRYVFYRIVFHTKQGVTPFPETYRLAQKVLRPYVYLISQVTGRPIRNTLE